MPIDAAGGPDLPAAYLAGDLQHVQQRRVPLEGVDIKEHRPGGVGIISHMAAAAGEVPNEPGVYRAEEQFARLRSSTGSGNVVQYPAELGPGEVGVRDQGRS